MSKKHKKSKYFDTKKKKNKKKSGGKKSAYKAPKGRDIKETLSKKDAKANKKVVVSPVDVPKDFRKNRQRCNHAGASISVAEYQSMTAAYAAYTPALERVVAMFGADNVSVCKSCYDVIVKRSAIEADKVYDALTYLYAAVNVALSNRKLKADEVKELSKLKDVIFDFQPVMDILDKIADTDEDTGSKSSGGAGLNNNPGGAFVS